MLDISKVTPLTFALFGQCIDYVLVEGVKELVVCVESEIMRLDGLLCGPVFEECRQGVALSKAEVTFLGGSGKVYGILSCLGSRGGYLMSAGTMSLDWRAAL